MGVVKLHLFIASTLDGADTRALYSRNESIVPIKYEDEWAIEMVWMF
jgi:hypothetical protein